MTADSLTLWRISLGLSQVGASAALGCSRNAYRRWEREGAPLYIALACAALSHGLAPK